MAEVTGNSEARSRPGGGGATAATPGGSDSGFDGNGSSDSSSGGINGNGSGGNGNGSNGSGGAAADRAAEGRLVKGRIQGWLDEASGRERARTGNLPSRWRDIERVATQLYDPPAEVVRSQNRALALGAQIFLSPQRVRSGPLPRGEAPVKNLPGTPEGMNIPSLAQEQTAALQAAWEDPVSWRHTEVELSVGLAGEILSLRVVVPSGSAKLDRIALDAVRRAAEKKAGPGEAAVTRWVVRSAISVVPPDRIGLSFDETGLIARDRRGASRFLSNGKAPFMEKVRTEVHLVSYLPRREPR